jgi:hypothetical protein
MNLPEAVGVTRMTMSARAPAGEKMKKASDPGASAARSMTTRKTARAESAGP